MYKYIQAILILSLYFIYGITKINRNNRISSELKYKVKNIIPFKLSTNVYKSFITLLTLFEIIAPIMIIYSFGSNKKKDIANYFLFYLILLHVIYMLIYHLPKIKRKSKTTKNNSKYSKNISPLFKLRFPKKFNKFFEHMSILGGLLLLRSNIV